MTAADRPLEGRTIGLLTAWASRANGGVFEAVAQQAAMIRRLGGEAHVFALADESAAADRARFGTSEVHLASVFGPRQIGFAPELGALIERVDPDLLHLHGIWMYPSAAGARWARRSGKPYIVSPHGMLDPWIVSRGKAKKALARLGYERASWRRAAVLHALTEREARDIARQTGRGDSAVVPNAGPPAQPPADALRGPNFLYLGRIHPKKNIGSLLDAWDLLGAEAQAAGASLTIAGWGSEEDVADLQRRLQTAPSSVRFAGPLFGEEKARVLSEARFFVLPSLSEGLPMVVLEAWAAGTPVLMTPECNLPEGFEAGAASDCGYDAPSIAAALRRGLSIDEPAWLAMSASAVRLASGPFSAAQVASRWGQCYRAAIEEGSRQAAK